MPANIDLSVSRHLKLLSGLSAVLVVYIHATTTKYDSLISLQSMVGKTQSYLSHDLFHVALPIFFMNSAFFLFLYLENIGELFQRIARRPESLLMPYLAWSGFWVVVGILANLLTETSISSLLRIWIFFPLPGQFWFLRDLIFLVILSPIIFRVPNRLLFLFAGFYWLWWMIDQTRVPLDARSEWYDWISNEAVSWFLIGTIAARHGAKVINFIKQGLAPVWLISTFIIWIAAPFIVLPIQFPHGFSVTMGTLFLIGLCPYIKPIAASHWVMVMSSFSFVIYAGHHPAMALMMEWLTRNANGNQMIHLLVYVLCPVLMIGLIIISFAILSRLCPAGVYILNGGRPFHPLRQQQPNITSS